jgi:2-methylcitrate dehydratase PrpD
LTDAERYRAALLDWLACAAAGRGVAAARGAATTGGGVFERIVAVGTAGHVLDFDDSYLPGLVHLSAPVAPAVLVTAGEHGHGVGVVLDAYTAGFELTAALARAGHPALYESGWHPTAVCGTVGAAAGVARLLSLDRERSDRALALATLRAGGLRAAFGSDGKALQVGFAAAIGAHAALLAQAGARVPLERVAGAAGGYAAAFGAPWAVSGAEPAVRANWIKPYPCCLATHSSIEAAEALRARGELPRALTVAVHPRSRQAAALDDVADGLEAKFSIPYLTAFTLLHGAPDVASFDDVDDRARTLARDAISIRVDDTLLESEARLEVAGAEVARVERAHGSPERPLDAAALARKVHALAGERLEGVLDDPARPAADVLAAAGLA